MTQQNIVNKPPSLYLISMDVIANHTALKIIIGMEIVTDNAS